MIEPITISLPSLIHRIGRNRVQDVQAVALQHRCVLKRVRRSRHWQLIGEPMQVQLFTAQIAELVSDSIAENQQLAYLYKKLAQGLVEHADQLEPLEVKLTRLINQFPHMTLAELMEHTQCSEAEARRARINADI